MGSAVTLLGGNRLAAQGAWPRVSETLTGASVHLHLGQVGWSTAVLLGTFLLNMSVPVSELDSALGSSKLRNDLVSIGVLWQPNTQVHSQPHFQAAVQVAPVATGGHRGPLYLVVDWDELRPWHQVMTTTIDTYALLRTQRLTRHGWTPRRVLDLCSGSGAQGLHAVAFFSQFRPTSVTLVDVNPRAVRFAKANVLLNSLPRVTLLHGNLYAALPRKCADGECGLSGQFDLILANPPYVPSMGGGQLFVAGGSTGEAVTQSIISGASGALAPNGWLLLVANLANIDFGYIAKLRRWWRKEDAGDRGARVTPHQEFDVSFHLVHGDVWTTEEYAGGFIGSSQVRMEYTNFLHRVGIKSMANGLIFAKRWLPARAVCQTCDEGNALFDSRQMVPDLWHALADCQHHRHDVALATVAKALDERVSPRFVSRHSQCPCERCVCVPTAI